MKRILDLTGAEFGMLTVLARDGVNKGGNSMWRCRCECGNETRVASGDLRTEKVQSCGCRRKRAP